MGRQDVRRALEAMEADDDVQARLAAGDFAAVEGLDLSPEEQTLVQDAANDMPEVAGFSFSQFLTIDGIKGESQDDKHKDEIEVFSALGLNSIKWQAAARYGLKL